MVLLPPEVLLENTKPADFESGRRPVGEIASVTRDMGWVGLTKPMISRIVGGFRQPACEYQR